MTSTQVYIIERRPQPRRGCQFRSQASVSRTWCFNHACASRGDPPSHRLAAGLWRHCFSGPAGDDFSGRPRGAFPALGQPELWRLVRADYQRPFDRLRCRLAGADFLDVFAAGRLFFAATGSAGACSGNATTWEVMSPAAVSGRLPNLMRRNTAAFCASNPRRAAVKVRASQGSIRCSPMTQCDASRSQPLRGVRVPTSAASSRNTNEAAWMRPNTSPKCIVPAQRPKIIRKVSNFDQTTPQNGETFVRGALWVGALHEEAMQLSRQSRPEDVKSTDRPGPHLDGKLRYRAEPRNRARNSSYLIVHLLAHYRRMGGI